MDVVVVIVDRADDFANESLSLASLNNILKKKTPISSCLHYITD